jgi:Domain of unknown function (DUF4184)
MPFTVSHAAAALPFGRLKPVWPALVIGTLAPDFEYFLRLTDEDRMGHHLPGLVILTLPLAILVYWLFEFYIRAPAQELLPEGLQRRLPKARAFAGWRGLVGVVAWIVLGIATHVVWDWFTHPHTWIWEHVGWLRQKVPVPFHPPVVMSKLVQHASSLIGLVALVVWFAVWYHHAAPANEVRTKQLLAARKIATVGAIAAIAVGTGYPLGFMRDFDLDPALNPIGLSTAIFESVTLIFCLQILLYGIVRTYSVRSGRDRVRHVDSPHEVEPLNSLR